MLANFHQQLNKELNKKKSLSPCESKDKTPKINPNVFNVFISYKQDLINKVFYEIFVSFYLCFLIPFLSIVLKFPLTFVFHI